MSEELPLDQNGHLFGDGDTVWVFGTDGPGRAIVDPRFSYRCAWCDAAQDFRVDGGTVRQPEPCPFPEGITTVVELAVPSGKIVVYDDLRPVYNGFDGEGFACYNSVLGQAQVIRAFAKQGCAFGPVGNSCPGLYRTGEGAYVIASPEYSEEKGDNVLPDGWTYKAGIITDLWAYSIADLDDYGVKGGVLDNGRWNGPEVVDVPPGTYQFTHHTGRKGFDRDAPGTVVFADMVLVRL